MAVKLTRKDLLDLAQDLGAVELKTGDPEVVNVFKTPLRCIAYSWGTNGFYTGRIYRDCKGNFYVTKTHDAECYVAKMWYRG